MDFWEPFYLEDPIKNSDFVSPTKNKRYNIDGVNHRYEVDLPHLDCFKKEHTDLLHDRDYLI